MEPYNTRYEADRDSLDAAVLLVLYKNDGGARIGNIEIREQIPRVDKAPISYAKKRTLIARALKRLYDKNLILRRGIGPATRYMISAKGRKKVAGE